MVVARVNGVREMHIRQQAQEAIGLRVRIGRVWQLMIARDPENMGGKTCLR